MSFAYRLLAHPTTSTAHFIFSPIRSKCLLPPLSRAPPSSIARQFFSLSRRQFLSQTNLDSLRKWLTKPVNARQFLRSLRISGLFLTCSALPAFRSAECAKSLSKRVDHLRDGREFHEEPPLRWADLFALIAPHFLWLVAAVVVFGGLILHLLWYPRTTLFSLCGMVSLILMAAFFTTLFLEVFGYPRTTLFSLCGMVSLILMAAFLTALLNIQIPLYLGDLINAISQIIKDQANVGKADLSVISPIAWQLISSYAAQAGLTFLYIAFLTVLGERMAADIRKKLFDRLLYLDMAFYDAQKTGELNSRLNVDVQEFKSSFKMTIAQGLRTMAQVIGCMWSLCRISPQMTLLTMSALPLLIGVGAFCGMLLRALSRRAQAQSAVAAAVAEEAFGNIRTVRAFAMEPQESRLFSREVDRATRLQEELGIGIGLFQGGTNLFLNGVVLSVLYGGSNLIANGQLLPGDLMAFLVTAQTIQKSLSQLSIVFGSALKGYTAAARVFQFANLEPMIRTDDGICIPYHSFSGDIQFEGVHFCYPTRPGHPVLADLNLTVPGGQVVALCGPSGEGKSTIVSLLERFYDPQAGKVTVDGKDVRELNLEWLRGQAIGLISQEPVLFATSIAENIRYGKPGATDEEVREAARLANADSFISEFPNGYMTVVGERGAQLSGGQRQRIAIARALLKDPPILVLDEATSALDSESERVVKQALERAMKGRTVLIIAHRLSTIQAADKIVVIQKGRVLEEGNHATLMRNRGPYSRLVAAQTQS